MQQIHQNSGGGAPHRLRRQRSYSCDDGHRATFGGTTTGAAGGLTLVPDLQALAAADVRAADYEEINERRNRATAGGGGRSHSSSTDSNNEGAEEGEARFEKQSDRSMARFAREMQEY